MKKPPPNPAGREGKPLKIPLAFDDALRASLETKPPPAKKKRPSRRKRKAA